MALVTTAVAAVAAVGVSAYGAYSQGRAAKDANRNAKEAADRQADIAERQQAIADKQWDRYTKTFQPVEDQFIEESKGYGSIANQENAASKAQASITGAFAGLRDRLNKTPGLNANNQAYAQEQVKLGLAEAAAGAAAQNAARENEKAKARAAQTDVINLGKGTASNALGTLSAAGGTYGGVANLLGAQAAQANQQAANAWSGVGSMAAGLWDRGAFKGFGGVSNWLNSGNRGFGIGAGDIASSANFA